MFQDPYGYEYTWDPAFSEDGTTVKAASDDFPAFKMAANYTPGVELTADWLKNPSTALSVREGKWYLPSYGEVRTAYQSILRGTFARINGSEIIQEKEFDINKYYMYMENFIRIGILQAGGNVAAFDKDPDAIAYASARLGKNPAFSGRYEIYRGDFKTCKAVLREAGIVAGCGRAGVQHKDDRIAQR